MPRPLDDYRAERTSRTTVVFTTDEVTHQPHRPDRVEIRFDNRDDSLPIAVKISAPDGLRPSDLRRLPWDSWFWFARVARQEMTSDSDAAIHIVDARVAFADQTPAPKRPGRRGHTTAHYQEIAARYTQLLAEGVRSPTLRISRERHVSRDTAAGWVRGARDRGLLPPAKPGRAG
jgi:hypothetical protein